MVENRLTRFLADFMSDIVEIAPRYFKEPISIAVSLTNRKANLLTLPPIRFPRGPEVWRRDEALEAEAEPSQAPSEQRHQAARDVLALALRMFFSAGVLFSTLSHMPVETAR